jgi:hypothetical protein
MIQTRRNSHSRRERRNGKSRQVRTQRRMLQTEQLETRTMLSANPFHNGFWPEDVTNDLRVDARDALIVINAMNQGGSRELLNSSEPTPAEAEVPYLMDVSGDGALTAIDALRIVNTVNGGEGETAPEDVVRYRLQATDLNGDPLANNTVTVGQTFQLQGFVQDTRTLGTPTGVFAAYMDVLMTNADNAMLRFGETQELRMDTTRPGNVNGGYDTGGVFEGGTFTLSYQGQTTSAIKYYGIRSQDGLAIQQALEQLPNVGTGNVVVTTLQGDDFDGRYFIRFKGDLGEQDVAGMTVQASDLTGAYYDDLAQQWIVFDPVPAVIDDYIPVDPETPDQQAALFRSSFEFRDPYTNGPSALAEPLEAGQPEDGRNLGEIGGFLNVFSLTNTRQDYNFFTVEFLATAGGQIDFSGNHAEQNKTLVFSLPGGGSGNTEVPAANIGFWQDQDNPLTVTILAPITVVDDAATVAEDSNATSINVLGNDAVNVAAGGVAPLSLASVGAVSPAGAATVSISGNSVSFTPTANFNGQVTLTYQAQDSATPTAHTAPGTVTVTVTPVNDPPVVVNDTVTVDEDAVDTIVDVLANDTAGPADEPQTLTVSAVGTPDQGGTVTLGEGGANVVYNPQANFFGTEKFTYTARDSEGATTVGTVTVTVTPVNDPPLAVDDSFAGITEDSDPVAFDVLANDSPGPLEEAVDTIEVVAVTPGSHGGTVTFTAANVSYQPAANFFGQETFTYTIRDSGGLEDTASVTVTVVNVDDPPEAVDDNLEVDEMSTDNPLDVLANDTPGPFEGAVDAITIVAVTSAGHGDVAIGNGGANVLYTPAGDFFGLDSFTYTIRDNGGAEATATVTVDVVPVVRPRARADQYNIQEDATAATAPALDVLANDLPNIEPPGTKVTLLEFTQPSHGVVTLLDNGTAEDLTDDQLRYVPNANYFGNDSFTYTINDTSGAGADSTATVSINVVPVNDPPTLDAIANPAPILEDAPQQTVNLTGITAGPQETQALEVTALSSNTGLIPTPTVTYTSPNTTGTLAYTPVANQSGTSVVTVTVKDAGLDGILGTADDGSVSQSFTVTVTPVNDAPTITAPEQAATLQDENFVFTAGTASAISVADIDSAQMTVGLTLQADPLSPAVNPGALILGTTQGVTITAGSDNSDSVTFSGSLAAVNAALNGLTFAPAAGYEGAPALQITASDGEFVPVPTANVGIIVSGINDPPVNILPAGQVAVDEDTDLVFGGNLQTSDPDAGLGVIEVTLAATNGTLTPVAQPNVTVTPMGTGTVKLEGAIANINAALNGLVFRPNQDYNGPAQLVITTNDNGHTGFGGPQTDTDTLAITVNPVNDAPVANDDGSPTDRSMVLWNSSDNPFEVLVNDNTGPDVGETLTITDADTTNAHGTVTIQNGTLLYTPTPGFTGNAEIVYTINDRPNGSGLTDTATVYLVVVDFVPSDVSGYVYFDADDDGVKDPGEWGIGGVRMTLMGTDVQGNPVNLSAWTDATGRYLFDDVMPSQEGTSYALTQYQPAAFLDGKDTVGDQGGTMLANDQMGVALPLFGHAPGILGADNNFGEMGFRADFVGLGLHDLLHSGTDGEGDGGLLFGTDAFGNLLWYLDIGGWNGYVPGQESPANSNNFQVPIGGETLPLTDTRTGTTHEINANDDAIRSMYRSGTWMTRILGDCEDFDLPNYPLAAAGEGESLSELPDAELLAAADEAGLYEAAVDAILAAVA